VPRDHDPKAQGMVAGAGAGGGVPPRWPGYRPVVVVGAPAERIAVDARGGVDNVASGSTRPGGAKQPPWWSRGKLVTWVRDHDLQLGLIGLVLLLEGVWRWVL
jgi:hypothetical protein